MITDLIRIFREKRRRLKEERFFEKERLKLYTKDKEKYSHFNIGAYTYGEPRVLDWGEGSKLKIGKFCSISGGVNFFLGGEHRIDWVTTYPFNVISEDFPSAKDVKGHPLSKGDIVIGNDVWIGYGATIMSGVTIGDGAVIGANSVVSKNIVPYSVNAGNPSRHIKLRFTERQIEDLLSLKWWDLEPKYIDILVEELCSPDVDKLIESLKSIRNTNGGIKV